MFRHEYRTTTEAEAYNFLKSNFNAHHGTNKAPFGVHLHAAWFLEEPANFDGYLHFLDDLVAMDDVYIVTVSQVGDSSKILSHF